VTLLCPVQCGFRATFSDSVMLLTFDLHICDMSWVAYMNIICNFIYFRTTVFKLARKTQHFILSCKYSADILLSLLTTNFYAYLIDHSIFDNNLWAPPFKIAGHKLNFFNTICFLPNHSSSHTQPKISKFKTELYFLRI
jgi:hypothetical protein